MDTHEEIIKRIINNGVIFHQNGEASLNPDAELLLSRQDFVGLEVLEKKPPES